MMTTMIIIGDGDYQDDIDDNDDGDDNTSTLVCIKA